MMEECLRVLLLFNKISLKYISLLYKSLIGLWRQPMKAVHSKALTGH